MPIPGATDSTSSKQASHIRSPTTPPTHTPKSTTTSPTKSSPHKDTISSHPDGNKKASFTKWFFSGLKLIFISLARLLSFIYSCAVNLFSKSSKMNRFEKWNLANGNHLIPDINANPNYLVPDLNLKPNYIPDLVKYYREELNNAQTEEEALRILHEEFTAFCLQLNSATRLTIERAIASMSRGNTSRTSSHPSPSSSAASPMNRFLEWENRHPNQLITAIVEYFGEELTRANDQPSITQLFDEFDEFVSQLDRKETVVDPLNVKLSALHHFFSDEKNSWITARLSPKKPEEKSPQITTILSMIPLLGKTDSPIIKQALQAFGLTPDVITSIKQQASELMEQGEEGTEEMVQSLMQQLRETDSAGAVKTLQQFGLTPELITSLQQQASTLISQAQNDRHSSSESGIPLD